MPAFHSGIRRERRKIAFEILELDDRLREIYTRIEHYERTGILLPKPEITVKNNISGKDAGELIKRQYSVRTYLTRYKKLLEESVSLNDRDRYQKKLMSTSRKWKRSIKSWANELIQRE